MVKKRKQHDETPEQTRERRIKETIANFSSRSEKTSWNRKMDNMVKIISQLNKVEDKILDVIREEKQPLMDQVHELRRVMTRECVHPYEYLDVKDSFVECKFCGKRLSIPEIDNER